MEKSLVPIRLSHVIGHSGVGAIIRTPDWLGVVQDIRHWTDQSGAPAGEEIPYVERLRAALEIDQTLRTPPIARETRTGVPDGTCLPVTRFPRWARCPSCGALYHRPWADDSLGRPSRCNRCQKRARLRQVTWILVDPRGYLADVPWHYLAHRDAPTDKAHQCRDRDHLRLEERGDGSRRLACETCKASVQFTGKERFPFGTGSMQPWSRGENATAEDPPELAAIHAIHDSRVYHPVNALGLVIPPESRLRKGTPVDRLYRTSTDRQRLDVARSPLIERMVLRELAAKYRCTVEDVKAAKTELDQGYPTYAHVFTPGTLRESEFKAFLETIPDQQDDEDFVTQDRSDELHKLLGEQPLFSGIEHLVCAKRLKGVKVFKGFGRSGTEIVAPDLVGQSAWLPAVELYGEGIFLALNEDRLRCWEDSDGVQRRFSKIAQRFTRSARDDPPALSARFVLMHTLAHLLIREIESEGGYPAAALSERLYCARTPEAMAGILIWVAVPDIAGSLGGLAELAAPKRFAALLQRTREHARWCSLDPVCSEHDGQGPELLNLAACHACVLIPEPACDYGNALLDRVFVRGDTAAGIPDFFDPSW